MTFEQILTLVKQLPTPQKSILSKKLEKATLNTRLTELLNSFQTEDISLETITEEVEAVRAEIYAIKTRKN
ncbi:MAG: hypothetical protein SXA11_25090 [Cyanobacteriota bacterium]|nr:hypothetical protein [Cyanobacteriota bacterium]